MILQKIVENKREEVARQKEILPLGELRQMLADRPPTRDFEGAIRNRDCAVIAEVKRSSPSKGRIREDFDPVGIAGIYEDNGASAISILTERKFFEGSAAYIPQIRRSVDAPAAEKGLHHRPLPDQRDPRPGRRCAASHREAPGGR